MILSIGQFGMAIERKYGSNTAKEWADQFRQ